MDPTPRIYVAVPGTSGRPISYGEGGKVVLFDKNSQLYEAIKPGDRVKSLVVYEKENYILVAPIEILPGLPVEAPVVTRSGLIVNPPPAPGPVALSHAPTTAHIAPLPPLQGEVEVYAVKLSPNALGFRMDGIPKKYHKGKFRVVFEFLGEISTSGHPNRKSKNKRRRRSSRR